MDISFGFRAVASPLHDPAALTRLLDAYRQAFAALGGSERPDNDHATEPTATFVLTGGTEHTLVEAWHRRQPSAPGEPLCLITHPGQNSLPAALEALARVEQEGGTGWIVHFSGPTDAPALRRLAEGMQDLAVYQWMHAARVGLVGDPSDWLVASSPTGETVRRAWGPRVVPVNMDEALTRYVKEAKSPTLGAVRIALRYGEGATRLDHAAESDVAAAAAFLPALEQVVFDHHLDALTVRCFDLLKAAGTSGCLALAECNDEGMVAGCEGDLMSTVAMIWARRLLGQVSWMANPVWIDEDAGTVRLAHCTVAPSLTNEYRLTTHFESGLGVAIAADLVYTDVTLIRIGGRDMDRVWIADGRSLPTVNEPDLCRTQLDVHIGVERTRELLEHPLGNHLVVVSGHHGARLTRWWERMVRPAVASAA